ncbi:hypothetical protein [Planococcus ruber]|uniref:hypothetical protein n=1 Tax=Planococcus ruber TaxID=2027871 RepID=UPI001FEDAF5F|nr:hypothetical protein [Planococcus ruber]MCJ1908978.1 hypothetical protein [Planococcus ruber]
MDNSKLRLREGENGITVRIGKYNVLESIQYIQINQIKNVEISEYYQASQIDFLSDCPSIESVGLYGPNVNDLSGLYKLEALKALSIGDLVPVSSVDFSQLSSLEEIYGTLPPKAKAIGSLHHLKSMKIWSYKPKGKNLEEFRSLKALEKLELITSNITSLDGIQGLTRLRHLELYGMRSLKEIEAIQELSGNLRSLSMEGVKNIQNLSPIGKVQSLEQLDLNNCGTIPSIGFIKQLPHLNSIQFWDTTVLDGDVSPCINLDYAYFTNKKHYSHRLKDVYPPTFIEKPKRNEEGEAALAVPLLPTDAWKIRMEEDDLFTEENLAAVADVLEDYQKKLLRLRDPSEKQILKQVEKTVLRLNALNDQYDYFIETMEREELQEFLMEKAQEAGLETEEDVTEEWREW